MYSIGRDRPPGVAARTALAIAVAAARSVLASATPSWSTLLCSNFSFCVVIFHFCSDFRPQKTIVFYLVWRRGRPWRWRSPQAGLYCPEPRSSSPHTPTPRTPSCLREAVSYERGTPVEREAVSYEQGTPVNVTDSLRRGEGQDGQR